MALLPLFSVENMIYTLQTGSGKSLVKHRHSSQRGGDVRLMSLLALKPEAVAAWLNVMSNHLDFFVFVFSVFYSRPFTSWICEINTMDFGNSPSGVPGYHTALSQVNSKHVGQPMDQMEAAAIYSQLTHRKGISVH